MKTKFLSVLIVLTVLLCTFIPTARASPAQAIEEVSAPNRVIQISLSQASPNILRFNDNVTVNFRYVTNFAAGVHIYAVPFSGAVPTPNRVVCVSPLYPAPNGIGACNFTITNGAVTVDRIRIQMLNAGNNILLFQAYIPVNYQFRGGPNSPNRIHHLGLTPLTPNIFKFNKIPHQILTVKFYYDNVYTVAPVHIKARPYAGAMPVAPAPVVACAPAPLLVGNNKLGFCNITIANGPVTVTSIRLQMFNPAETVMLFDAYLPVYDQFRNNATTVSWISLSPPNPNILSLGPAGHSVTVSYRYDTTIAGGVRIYARPYSGAAPTVGAVVCPVQPVRPFPSGVGSCSFVINNPATVTVDRIRIQAYNTAVPPVLVFDIYIPVYYLFR